MDWIDLRSDTVTLPTPEMRQAMAEAELGDDVYGEDPAVNRLQALAAERLGKEAALFVPSGTMGNLAAILAYCQRGDEAILGGSAHTFMYEAGGMAALGGVQPHTIPNEPDGTLPLDQIEAAVRGDDPHYPRTSLIVLENTHNRCGGVPLTPQYTYSVGELARRHGIGFHLDGARIFNAAIALDVPVLALVEPADSVMFCLSKGLSAPVGSMLCGDQAFIREAHRARKMLGGGMRQAGVVAAAGIVALETMVDRLAEDHARAARLAQGLAQLSGVSPESIPPASNMVYLSITGESPLDAELLTKALRAEGVRVGPVGKNRMRLVLHSGISDSDVDRVVEIFRRTLRVGP
jgi:threonine aldolase